ncbi:MAG: calcium-binding protein [Solirubrobacterales bacterium]
MTGQPIGSFRIIAGSQVSRIIELNPRITFPAFTACFALLAAGLLAAVTPQAEGAGKICFGEEVNRVINASDQSVRVGFKDVVWVSAKNVRVIGKPYSRICAGAGSQTVEAGKGRSLTDTGPGNDRIILHAKSNLNTARGGLGNDLILGSNGNDFLYGSPRSVSRQAADRDVIRGLRGNDTIYDYGGIGNQLYGVTGVDTIHSLGRAVSSSFGGNGSDVLFSDGGRSGSGLEERLFGDRGNDRLNADRPGSDGPAFLDGGSGDDWLNGTSFSDTILIKAGITKVKAGGGDDFLVSTSAGVVTVDGGSGEDLISFATHTPATDRPFTGVDVDLRTGVVKGNGKQTLNGVENVIGSSFEDTIAGLSGVTNEISGGLGDDQLIGQLSDRDVADGGLGLNDCSGFYSVSFCGSDSPGNIGAGRVSMNIDQSGVLSVLGSSAADQITVGFEREGSQYRIRVDSDPVLTGRCSAAVGDESLSICESTVGDLNGILVYGGSGADRVEIEPSVPGVVTALIDGGPDENLLLGGNTRDTIRAAGFGSIVSGGANDDQLYISPGGRMSGGAGSDVLHSQDPCLGGNVSGGTGDDNLVFGGSPQAVTADLANGYARWSEGGCGKSLRLAPNLESLEGTRYDDTLILGRKLKGQTPRRSLLGRGGIDTLNARNGVRDSITTGDNGRRNRVIADPIDKVIWGWGYAAF